MLVDTLVKSLLSSILKLQKTMKNLTIRAIGTLGEPWHKQAIHTYASRLEPFGGIEVIELPEGHKKSAKPDIAQTQSREAESLLKGIPPQATIIALDETGKEYDSLGFSKKLEEWSGGGKPVVFLIGGSWGLHADIRAKAQAIVSLGKMTLPHALARIVLLEQIYRAVMIQRGKEYHK